MRMSAYPEGVAARARTRTRPHAPARCAQHLVHRRQLVAFPTHRGLDVAFHARRRRDARPLRALVPFVGELAGNAIDEPPGCFAMLGAHERCARIAALEQATL